ncbi:MAG: superoxide dismutase family protein [Rhodococcus sp.]|nr:superoxide dismutase family protein [Rhodococcus sp. (in: high G+C Gram-positive bacteria)]
MARSTTRRMSWRVITPVVAIAALGLSACSNSEEPSDVPGTTPPVWTGSAAPEGSDDHHGDSHGDDHGDDHGSGGSSSDSLSADLVDGSGAQAGTAKFRTISGGVEVTLTVVGMSPGFHGVHVHAVGTCEANSTPPAGGDPGMFLSSGGHFQVEGHSDHPSSGDLTSIQVLEDGTGKLVTTTDSFTLSDLEAGSGTSIMVHAGPDNFGNIPTRYAAAPDAETLATGDAGPRVACGVISEGH